MVPGLFTSIILAATPATAFDAAELSWAKGVVHDFWTAALEAEYPAAVALLSPEFTAALTGNQSSHARPGDRLAAMVNKYRSAAVSYSATELAPDRGEVIVRGRLMGNEFGHDNGRPVTGEFTMRVAKGASGRWAVRYLRVKEVEGEKK
jgi:hypothetical protein